MSWIRAWREWLLRLIAHRPRLRPDYGRIAELEMDLGYRERPRLTFLSPPAVVVHERRGHRQ
jgi:hypothetical protein